MAMAVTCRASLSLLSSLSSSSAASNPAQPRRCVLMAASRSSHVGGSWDLLSAKQRLSSASSVKAAAPRAAIASPASSTGATSQGVKQALISLSDKRNLELLAKGLGDLGYKLVSSGGTATALEKAGYSVTRVEQLTSFPEMLDGRVKTLHPAIHGGILARRDMEPHMEALQQHGIGTIDVVVVNLYPFYSTVTSSSVDFETGVESIDIGGPSMIRAAAKVSNIRLSKFRRECIIGDLLGWNSVETAVVQNHKDVMVVVDPDDYSEVIAKLQSGDDGDNSFRRRLAWKAFQHASSYDSAVAEWLWKHQRDDDETTEFPPSLTVPLTLKSKLRYGENPHQRAAFYEDKSLSEFGAGGIATAVQYHGKEMSYNNYLDADAAWNCVCEFNNPTCVVVKHTNPCGVASVGPNQGLLEAYRLAVRADPVSAFGGIVAFNVEVDETLAREIREFRSPTDGETRMFYEIVVAPSYTEKGLEILKGKSKTLRILKAEHTKKGRRSLRQIGGGWLLQDSDDKTPEDLGFRVVTSKVPTLELVDDAQFAWLCCKHVKSNAIVVAKDNRMLGMGSGQPNRVKSLQIALEKAGEEAKGAALASDAFFPFAWNDAVEDACKAGVKVIAQPGGSMRDQDAIDCCNNYGVAMLFTEVRHFRH